MTLIELLLGLLLGLNGPEANGSDDGDVFRGSPVGG